MENSASGLARERRLVDLTGLPQSHFCLVVPPLSHHHHHPLLLVGSCYRLTVHIGFERLFLKMTFALRYSLHGDVCYSYSSSTAPQIILDTNTWYRFNCRV